MLCGEIMVVYCKEHTSTAQNIDLLLLNPVVLIIITWVARLAENTTYHGSCASVSCPSAFTYVLTHINHGSIFIFLIQKQDFMHLQKNKVYFSELHRGKSYERYKTLSCRSALCYKHFRCLISLLFKHMA